MLAARDARRDVREHEVVPAVARDGAVRGGKIGAHRPFLGGDLALDGADECGVGVHGIMLLHENRPHRPHRPHRARRRSHDRVLLARHGHGAHHLRRRAPRPRLRAAEDQPAPVGARVRAEGVEARARSLDLCFITETPLDDVIARLKENGIVIVDGPVPKTGRAGPDDVGVLPRSRREPDRGLQLRRREGLTRNVASRSTRRERPTRFPPCIHHASPAERATVVTRRRSHGRPFRDAEANSLITIGIPYLARAVRMSSQNNSIRRTPIRENAK